MVVNVNEPNISDYNLDPGSARLALIRKELISDYDKTRIWYAV